MLGVNLTPTSVALVLSENFGELLQEFGISLHTNSVLYENFYTSKRQAIEDDISRLYTFKCLFFFECCV